jgi:NADP-dependent 3-hydroxy acid dehydrogenase YdfG
MVNLSDVRTSNATLAERHGLVYIFAGGTSGIGEATLRALAAHATDPTVFIIGRTEQRAAEIIDACRKICPEGTFEFLRADLTLLRNVDEVCAEVGRRVKKVDVLFMTQNYFTIQGRDGRSSSLWLVSEYTV